MHIIHLDSLDDFAVFVNLGNPAEFTILELAEKVIELTGSKSKIVFKPLPSDDPKQRQPDITQAKENLNWQPSVPLEEGLKRTVNYFEELLKNEPPRRRDGGVSRKTLHARSNLKQF